MSEVRWLTLAVVVLVVLFAGATAAGIRHDRALLERLERAEVDRKRRSAGLHTAHEELRALRAEVGVLRAEWPHHVEARFPDDAPPTITVNGLPCERGLRGCDLEAVREEAPGQPAGVVLYLVLPTAPEAPRAV